MFHCKLWEETFLIDSKLVTVVAQQWNKRCTKRSRQIMQIAPMQQRSYFDRCENRGIDRRFWSSIDFRFCWAIDCLAMIANFDRFRQGKKLIRKIDDRSLSTLLTQQSSVKTMPRPESNRKPRTSGNWNCTKKCLEKDLVDSIARTIDGTVSIHQSNFHRKNRATFVFEWICN